MPPTWPYGHLHLLQARSSSAARLQLDWILYRRQPWWRLEPRECTDSLNGLNSGKSNNGVFIGGGQVGANYQFNNFVVGVEGDFDWAANNNNTSNGVVVPSVGNGPGHFQQQMDNDPGCPLRLRDNRVLFYGKAGGGWVGNSNFTVTNATTGARSLVQR